MNERPLFSKNPYSKMTNVELEFIYNDILTSIQSCKKPETILPFAIEMQSAIGESCSLDVALEILKETFYLELAKRFFSMNKTKEHKIVNIGHVGTFDNRH